MADARRTRKPIAELQGGEIRGTFGIWLNKRELVALEVPLRHEIKPQNNGWRLDFLEAGKVTARHTEGARGIDVEHGDFVVSSGDDLYVALHRAGKGEGRDEPEDEDPMGKPSAGRKPAAGAS